VPRAYEDLKISLIMKMIFNDTEIERNNSPSVSQWRSQEIQKTAALKSLFKGRANGSEDITVTRADTKLKSVANLL
jgi:spore germination protein GerM